MPNALLSAAGTMGRTLPQGHCHFIVGMWRLRHAAATVMGGKEGGDTHISDREKVEDFVVSATKTGRRAFNSKARTVAQSTSSNRPWVRPHSPVTLHQSTNQHDQATFGQLFCTCETKTSP